MAGTTRIELARLRLGMIVQRARELEDLIREALANEQLVKLNQHDIVDDYHAFVNAPDNQEAASRIKRKMLPVIRALRLYTSAVVPWMMRQLSPQEVPDVITARRILREHAKEFSELDISLLVRFVDEVEQTFTERSASSS